MKTNIVLTGFMGTGKSFVGRVLAKKMAKELYDTDAIIEEREGDSIARIFQVKGEDYFRRVEKDIVKELSSKEDIIIATGGGVVLDKRNLNALKKRGLIICLTAEPSTILLRTSNKQDRPLLMKSVDLISTIRQLIKKRAPHYAKSDYTIDTTSLSVDDVVKKIERIWDNFKKNEKNFC